MRVTDRVEAAARAALTAGQLDAARRLVADGLAAATDVRQRAALVRLRARLSTWSGPIALEDWAQVVAAAEELAGVDDELAGLLLCDAAVLAAFTRQLPLAESLAERALQLTGGAGVVGALAAVDLGIACGLTGRLEQAGPLLDRAEEVADADLPLADAAESLLHVVTGLLVRERYDEAVDTAARFLGPARSLGAVGLLPLPLCLLAHAGWKAARWEEARMAAAEALPLAQATGEVALELYATAMLALVAGGRGREDACRQHADRALELSDATGIGMFRVTVQMAQVHLALGLDRPQDALAPLRAVGELMGDQRRNGMLNWHADHVDVLARLGRCQEAEAVLATLAAEADGNRWERAVLPRCQAQLDPDHEGAIALLQQSVQALAFQSYEQARSRLRLAQRLADAGQDPTTEATAALAAFERLRARGWAEQARALAGAGDPARHRTHDAVEPAVEHQAAPTSDVPCGELRLLGGFTVVRDGTPAEAPTGTAGQAVKVVALAGGRTSGDALVEALWPDVDPVRGRARLRNVLSRASGLLVRCGEEIALQDGIAVDVLTFLDEATAALAGSGPQAEALARRAVERHAGELLPADRYQEWAVGPRERVRTRHLQLLDRLTAAACLRGDVDEAAVWWERALDVEAYAEERYVAAATALRDAGRQAPAHRMVQRALAALDRLGVPPSPALTSLADELRR